MNNYLSIICAITLDDLASDILTPSSVFIRVQHILVDNHYQSIMAVYGC